ncbi:hypothetical protein KBD45_06375 [Candidatus Dojkabacteria bacterium]|nr:hypothetical protein [Candidatus Dojkabacteria bacterium]
MPENKDAVQPEQLWASLTEPEKEACIFFAVSDWKTGVQKNYTESMGIDNQLLEDLVSKKIVETKPTWELFQELANQLKSETESIRSKMSDHLYRLQDSERTVLQDHDRYQSIAESKNETPRYHLSDFAFHEYIKSLDTE